MLSELVHKVLSNDMATLINVLPNYTKYLSFISANYSIPLTLL